MTGFWASVTEPQATIIAAALTIVAAIAGVALGAWLFGGRVKDLGSAIEATDKILKAHKSEVDVTLTDIKAQIGSMVESLGQLRGNVGDLQSANEPEGQNLWRETRDAWEAVRDKLEQIAVRPDIDGRTRAKYARIDRRRYHDLIASIGNDGYLAPNRELYEEAIGLWMRYRNGRANPTRAHLNRLQELQRLLTA